MYVIICKAHWYNCSYEMRYIKTIYYYYYYYLSWIRITFFSLCVSLFLLPLYTCIFPSLKFLRISFFSSLLIYQCSNMVKDALIDCETEQCAMGFRSIMNSENSANNDIYRSKWLMKQIFHKNPTKSMINIAKVRTITTGARPGFSFGGGGTKDYVRMHISWAWSAKPLMAGVHGLLKGTG